MPVSQRRPPVNELLNNAVVQQAKLNETKTEILLRPASIWIKDFKRKQGLGKSKQNDSAFHSENTSVRNDSVANESQNELLESIHFQLYKLGVIVSLNSERFLWYKIVRIVHIMMWPVAFSVLVYQVPQFDYTINSQSDFNVYVLDNLINSWFLLHGMCMIFGVYMRIKIEKAYHRSVSTFDAIYGSGVIQFIFTALCFGFGMTEVGMWTRLIRLALTTSTVLEVFPHITILLSGVVHGLKSISWAVMVLFVIILFYASLGHHLFAVNDPFHFGTYAEAALTFFQLSTFENWSTVFYTNFDGCDSFPNEYTGHKGPLNETIVINTGWGDFILPQCSNPIASPTASSLVFVSFTMIGGYVTISMCLAAVAIGINERLQALKRLSVYGADDTPHAAGGGGADPTRQRIATADHGGAKAGKLTGNLKEKAVMKTLLMQTWAEESPANMSMLKREKSTIGSFKLSNLVQDENKDKHAGTSRVMFFHYFVMSKYHDAVITCLILMDASLQIFNEGKEYNATTYGLHIFIQCMFSIDFLLRMYHIEAFTHKKQCWRFVTNFWNCFDFCIDIIVIATLALEGQDQYEFLQCVRFLRFVRIMKLYSATFGDLMVILNSLNNSFICVLYVIALVSVFFLLYSIAGVLLFKQANPYYFRDVESTLKTLLQVMSQDNWSNVMRTCMIGCRFYGSTGTPYIDDMCSGDALNVISGMGVGWWGAAYFVSFMIMASMVMANLMVGVIISSMEMLREGFKEETIVWENVRRIQRAFDIKAENIKRMLELWEMLDKNANGFLTFDETQPMMHLINYKEVKAFELYRRCDTNKNGQINFHEFCELVVDLGNKRHDPNNLEIPQEVTAAAKRNHAPGILSALTGSDKRKGSLMNGMTPQFLFGKGSDRMAALGTGRRGSTGVPGSPAGMGASGKVYSDNNQDMNNGGTKQPVDHSDKDLVHKPKRQPRTSFFSSLRKQSSAPSAKSANGDPLHPPPSPHSRSPGESQRPKTPEKVPFFTSAMRKLSDLVVDSKQYKQGTHVGDAIAVDGVSSLTEDHKADDQRNNTFTRQSLEDMVPIPSKINGHMDNSNGRQSPNVGRSRTPSPKGGNSGQSRMRLESLDGATALGLSGQDGVHPFQVSGHSQRSDIVTYSELETTGKFATKTSTPLNVASKHTGITENSPKGVHSRRVRVESMDQQPSTPPQDFDHLSDRIDLVGMEFKASKEFVDASSRK